MRTRPCELVCLVQVHAVRGIRLNLNHLLLYIKVASGGVRYGQLLTGWLAGWLLHVYDAIATKQAAIDASAYRWHSRKDTS